MAAGEIDVLARLLLRGSVLSDYDRKRASVLSSAPKGSRTVWEVLNPQPVLSPDERKAVYDHFEAEMAAHRTHTHATDTGSSGLAAGGSGRHTHAHAQRTAHLIPHFKAKHAHVRHHSSTASRHVRGTSVGAGAGSGSASESDTDDRSRSPSPEHRRAPSQSQPALTAAVDPSLAALHDSLLAAQRALNSAQFPSSEQILTFATAQLEKDKAAAAAAVAGDDAEDDLMAVAARELNVTTDSKDGDLSAGNPSDDEVLMVLRVPSLNADRQLEIRILRGVDSHTIATEFCRANGFPDAAIDDLTQFIDIHRQASTESGAADADADADADASDGDDAAYGDDNAAAADDRRAAAAQRVAALEHELADLTTRVHAAIHHQTAKAGMVDLPDPDLTFRPELNPNSLRIVSAKQNATTAAAAASAAAASADDESESPVSDADAASTKSSRRASAGVATAPRHDQLHAQAAELREKRRVRSEERTRELMRPAPTLNPKSVIKARIARGRPESVTDVVQRLYEHGVSRAVRRQIGTELARAEKEEEWKQYSYQPTINRNSSILAETGRTRAHTIEARSRTVPGATPSNAGSGMSTPAVAGRTLERPASRGRSNERSAVPPPAASPAADTVVMDSSKFAADSDDEKEAVKAAETQPPVTPAASEPATAAAAANASGMDASSQRSSSPVVIASAPAGVPADHSGDARRQRQQLLRQASRQAEADQHLSFQPRISAKSQALVAARTSPAAAAAAAAVSASPSASTGGSSSAGDTYDRLYAEADMIRQKKLSRYEQKVKLELSHTFEPNLHRRAAGANAPAAAGSAGSAVSGADSDSKQKVLPAVQPAVPIAPLPTTDAAKAKIVADFLERHTSSDVKSRRSEIAAQRLKELNGRWVAGADGKLTFKAFGEPHVSSKPSERPRLYDVYAATTIARSESLMHAAHDERVKTARVAVRSNRLKKSKSVALLDNMKRRHFDFLFDAFDTDRDGWIVVPAPSPLKSAGGAASTDEKQASPPVAAAPTAHDTTFYSVLSQCAAADQSLLIPVFEAAQRSGPRIARAQFIELLDRELTARGKTAGGITPFLMPSHARATPTPKKSAKSSPARTAALAATASAAAAPLNPDFTFRPQLSTTTQELINQKRAATPGRESRIAHAERLHAEHRRKEQNRQLAQQLRIEQEMAAVTFEPEVRPYKRL